MPQAAAAPCPTALPGRPCTIRGKATERVTMRLRLTGGRVTARQLPVLAEVAERFGRGEVHLTTRQSVEIPGVAPDAVDAARALLATAGLQTGSCGPYVRTVVACPAPECKSGVIGAQTLAERLTAHAERYGKLPHKFKIAVTGCPNSCAKPLENDFGVMGIVAKQFHADRCNGCGNCVEACKEPGVLKLGDGDTLEYQAAGCVGCGACVAACPVEAWEGLGPRFVLFAGGKMGRHPRFALRLPAVADSPDAVLAVLDRAVAWYSCHASGRERFGDTIRRVGEPAFLAAVQPA